MSPEVAAHLLILAHGHALYLARQHTYNKGVYGPAHESVGQVITDMELNSKAIGELTAAKALRGR
jgi:hypothetical protein